MQKIDRCDAGAKELGLLRLETAAHASALIPIIVPENSTHRRKVRVAS
jgi:hypothetical protein